MIEQAIIQDFPFLKDQIIKTVDVEAAEDGKSVTGRIICKGNVVYSFFIDKETVSPILQRFM